jgi:hypothetical protein
MPYFPYLYDSPFGIAGLLQIGMTIWMLVDANRRGMDYYWFWIILVFQPLGPWAYFFAYKIRELRGGTAGLGGLFQRRASLAELQYQTERSPTMANHLALAERLIEIGQPGDALPHLEVVLTHEPEHCQALYAKARCFRAQGHPAEAVPVLQKLIKRQSGWGNYQAWHTLVEVRGEAADPAGATESCRELLRVSPTLQHKCLLAEHLRADGQPAEARQLLEKALADYQFQSRHTWTNRRWAWRAKQMLKELG